MLDYLEKINTGLTFEKPEIFLPWNLRKEDFLEMVGSADIIKEGEKYCTLNITLYDIPYISRAIVEFEHAEDRLSTIKLFDQRGYPEDDTVKHFYEIQSVLRKFFGRPGRNILHEKFMDIEREYKWKFQNITIIHRLWDHFGMQEDFHIYIKKNLKQVKGRPMNYKKGKQIFFTCNGSHFFIDREFGDEYSKCNIPKEIEAQWRKEIKEKLLAAIASGKGSQRVSDIFAYVDLLSAPAAVDYLMQCIRAEDPDTFSLLLLAEHLKHYLRYADDAMKKRIGEELLILQNKLRHRPVTVDESYYREKWNIENALSEEAIRHRIETLTDLKNQE